MRKGWEMKRFEDLIAEQQIGLIRNAKEQNTNFKYRYLKMDSISAENTLIEGKCVYVDASKEEIAKFSLSNGDFLFNTRNSYELVGKTCVYQSKSQVVTLYNNNIMRIRFKKGISPHFINYAFSSEIILPQLDKLKSGTTSVVGIYFKGLKELQVPLPSLSEQQRIVAILDEAFAAIDKAKQNAERNLQNAKELFESYLEDIFSNYPKTWNKRTLKEICAKITDGTHQTPKYYETGIVFLSSKNVTKGKINWDDVKYIDLRQHKEMHKRVAPQVNDILLAKNGTTGVAAIVDKDVVFDIYVSLALLRTLGEVDARFLLYFVNSPVAKKQFNKRLKGSGVPNLHLEEIREVVITFPKTIKEQQVVVKKLDALSAECKKLESIYQQKINDLDELKKSILQKAFSGELTANEVVG